MEFAILYKEGDECPFLKKALDSMDAPYTHNFKDIFGDGDMEDYYYYIGAVTAPPCSENTVWLIYGEVKEASAEQILFFNNLWKNN